jgi:hypothetical protein
MLLGAAMETIRERNIGGVSDLGSSWQTHYLEDALFLLSIFPSGYRSLSNPSSDENATAQWQKNMLIS